MFVHMLGGGVPRGRAIVIGGGAGDGDGGFVDDPVVTITSTGDATVKGKVKPGSFGKFVFPLATIAAGRQYTFRYTPHFSQLAQQGKLAMVGFGLKTSNDFHIVGLRGDGTTGLNKYKVNGTPPNGWNVQTGHTTSDGGAAAAGTQAGPNYIRLVTSADGSTYRFQTSTNGTVWNTEYTGAAPTPFTNVSGVTTFGMALWFNNADAGPFSIDIDQFADAAAPVPMVASYEGATVDNTNATTYTFTAKNIGAAGAGRLVLVGVNGNVSNVGTSRAVSGVTANGNAMTKGPEVVGATGHGSVSWFYLPIAAGTTATFVVTFAGAAPTNCTIAVYRLFPVSGTPVDTASITGGTPQTLADLEVKTSGVAFFLSGSITGSGAVGSWTGVDSPIHDEIALTNDRPVATDAWSVPTTENDATRDFTVTLSGSIIKAVGISFQ
ncbi:hypothetical protein X735_12600 [Mesorhizobium sp. L2C085B000]|uniref:hypothetical protein n=1 Tax=Mesorhizobium sp. L2C085B000 TaxID=1287117 RepID=UPI0003CFFACE|nr:hypothetical protein [Mesorhizobium sp. L2C085B000]ESZ17800.1 hypothetical protein X735_12600 [Mesorhizobium sp. L2C085B000]